jgi:hypothetical protein
VIQFDALETFVGTDKLAISLPMSSPVNRGHVDAWISRTKGGPPAAGALVRQLVASGSVLPQLTLYAKDVRAAFPRGGRAFLVVSYAGAIIGTGSVLLVT